MSNPITDSMLPIDALASAESVKEVRTLRLCAHCGNIGNAPTMPVHRNDLYHGRCIIARFGLNELLALPKSEQDKCMLGDIGESAMRALLDYPNKHPKSGGWVR